MTTNDLAWAPDACTLPTVERPLRLAEFDDLFATSLRRVEPVTATHARLHLAGGSGVEATVRDLTARETACCGFFDFGVTRQGETLTVDTRVPARYADVLAALVARARAVPKVS